MFRPPLIKACNEPHLDILSFEQALQEQSMINNQMLVEKPTRGWLTKAVVWIVVIVVVAVSVSTHSLGQKIVVMRFFSAS